MTRLLNRLVTTNLLSLKLKLMSKLNSLRSAGLRPGAAPSHPNFSLQPSAFSLFPTPLVLALLLLAGTVVPGQAEIKATKFELHMRMANAGPTFYLNKEAFGLSDHWNMGGIPRDVEWSGYVNYGGWSCYTAVASLKNLRMWEANVSGNDPDGGNWKVEKYWATLYLDDGSSINTDVIQNNGAELTKDQNFSMSAIAEDFEKKLPNDPASIDCQAAYYVNWNADTDFTANVSDADGHSDYTMSAVVKSGSDIVPGTAVTISGMNPFTIGLKPNKDKSGRVTIELQCSDKYRQDANKTVKVTRTVTVDFQRPLNSPTLTLVSSPPAVRAGGVSETFQVRVSDDYTPAGEIRLWSMTGYLVGSMSNSNGLGTITFISPASVGSSLVSVVATDGDGQNTYLNVPVTTRADVELTRPTTSTNAYALLFNGTDSVNVPAGTWFNGDFTIEAWVCPNQFVSGASLLSFGNDASSDAVTLGFTGVSGQLSLQVRNGSQSQQLNSTSLISTSGWTHVAATLSQQRATLYINGQSAGILEGMPSPASVTRSLNRLGGGYAGFLDEVRLWSVARTPDEIQAGLYVGMATSSEMLVGYWPLNQGTGKFISNAAKSTKALAMGSTVPAEAMVPTWVEGVPYELVFTCNEDTACGFSFASWRSGGAWPSFGSYSFSQLPRNGLISSTSGSIPAAGSTSLTYTPFTDCNGSDNAVLVLRSYSGVFSAPQSIRFVVNPVNDTPIVGSSGYLDFDSNATSTKNHAVGGEGSKAGLDFSARDPFTLETWVYPRRRTEQELLGKWALGLPGGYRLFLTATDGKVAFARSRVDRNGRDLTDLSQMAVSAVSIPLNQWTHVAAVYDGAQSLVYINGQVAAMLADSANGLSAKTQPIRLAAAWDNASSVPIRLFSGAINETRIWSVARGATDLAVAMSSPLTGQESGLAAYYRMMEGRGSRLYDWAGKGLYNMSGVTSDALGRFTWWTGAANLTEVIVSEDAQEALIALPAIDVDRDTLTYEIVTQPSHGVAAPYSLDTSRYAYTPAANYTGTDSFTYRVIDSAGATQTGTIQLRVMPVNDPPAITSADSILIEEGTASQALNVAVSDPDSYASAVTLTVASLDPGILPAANVSVARVGTAPNSVQPTTWTLTIKPPAGTFGRVRVRLTSSDGDATSSREILVAILPAAAYQVVDMPIALPGATNIQQLQIDSAGRVCGYLAQYGQPDIGFIYDNLLYGGRLTLFEKGNSQVNGLATAADGTPWETGSYKVGSQITAFRRAGTNLVSIGAAAGVSSPVGVAINGDGTMAGYYTDISGRMQPFRLLRTITSLTADAMVASTVGGKPVAINKNGWVAGNSPYGVSSYIQGWVLKGTTLVRLDGTNSLYPYVCGLSDNGNMAGCLKTPASGTEKAALWLAGATTPTLIPLPSGVTWASSRATSVNDLGQAVGTGTLSDGTTAAFFFSGSTTYLLNRLLPDDSGWAVTGAFSINANGLIAGLAKHTLDAGGEVMRAVLVAPANIIGKRILRPEGSVARLPLIDVIEGAPGDQGLNSFFWSEVEKALYAIRPIKARIRWQTTFDVSDTNYVTIPTFAANIWPKDPQIHVAGAPTTVQPPEGSRMYEFASLEYSTVSSASVDATTKVFNCPTNTTGYSVVRYYRTDGKPLDPNTQTNAFTVAKTIYVQNSKYLTNSAWPIGTAIVDGGHTDYPGLNGYLFYPKTAVDVDGVDAAYDRLTRTGALLPVNTVQPNAPISDSPLVVVWYRMNEMGVAWAERPVLYTPYWPTNAPKIIIASAQGSNLGGTDPVTDLTYPKARIYVQSDPTQAGFNPNEEHAMLLPANPAQPDLLVFDTLPAASSGSQGYSVFALRNDLNKYKNYSQPFVLLKYWEKYIGQWRTKVYGVVAEQAPYYFIYPGLAGTEIQPPYPLSILPVSARNTVIKGVENTFKDYKGKVYSLAAGINGGLAEITMRHYYPLQSDFFYDLDTTAGADAAVGDPIPWLDRRTSGVTGIPVDVTYRIKWPETRAVLSVGESLMESKHGLPDVANMARVQVVFDSLNPQLTNGWRIGRGYMTAAPTNAARLYDPLSEHYVECGSSFSLPDIIRTTDGALGRKYFRDLPYHLRLRLSFDPINKWLYFKGVYDDTTYVGEPLLMPNVMSASERDTVQALDGMPGSAFDALVDDLYALARNPNELDLNGDGNPDDALLLGLQYAITNTTYVAGVAQPVYDTSRITLESLPAGFKTLTAAFGSNVAVKPNPGLALGVSGTDANYVEAAVPAVTNMENFTWEAWVKRTAASRMDTVLRRGTNNTPFRAGFDEKNCFMVSFEGQTFRSLQTYSSDVGQWHHWAGTYDRIAKAARVYRDGTLSFEVTNLNIAVNLSGPFQIGRGFAGQIDEVRLWHGVTRDQSQIQAAKNLRITSGRPELVGYWQMDDRDGVFSDSSGYRHHAVAFGSVTRELVADASAGWGQPPRFISLVENNDPLLGGLPVSVKVIEIGPDPYRGDLKVLSPDNVFDERLTLRLSSDFGGEPERFNFEWYYKPDGAGFDRDVLPLLDASGNVTDLRGWIAYPAGLGAGHNYITLGEGGESGLLTMSDNWFICRYNGYNVGTNQPWGEWIGDPSVKSKTWPMLAEGWIKRVVRGLNPFDERVNDFQNNQASTKISMVQQAGADYEGDIAFNPDGGYINSIGLIEAYETVLRRGRSLSTDGTPPVNYQPANDALLLITSRIADLYTLLGNEAMADAADPSIGFTTSSGEYGSMASSIFAFQNQLDSLLEEELVLLRGRDDSASGVQAAPVYNRLYWNFTMGDGEVAYQQVYNVSDQNGDGAVNETDARIMYPQGHGDAWGQYLTAIKSYYGLLRNGNFTWLPRTETVLLAGVPVKVDYQDERKFARIAAAKAKAGAEIVDLTYRNSYVEDPNGQWQGYLDTDRERAWGVDDWASRAAVGTYFDWLMANAILPASDPNPAHKGIDKIDRATVGELNELNAQLSSIQQQIDKADQGLNPIGLAKGMVPFDLDPALVDAGQTHFEQIYERAIDAMNNAVTVFDEVNGMNASIRGTQDTVEQFTQQVEEQERDYKNRLIEIFGYPYAGDIGPGKTYCSGYDGPDLLHYQYIATKEISEDTAPPSDSFTAFFKPIAASFGKAGLVFPQDTSLGTNGLSLDSDAAEDGMNVEYPISAGKYAFVAPAEWGLRRAPGELQSALSDLVQAETSLKRSLRDYDTLLRNIEETLSGLDGEVNDVEETIKIKEAAQKKQRAYSGSILAMKQLQIVMNRAAEIQAAATEVAQEALPKVVGLATDATAPARAAVKGGGFLVKNGFSLVSDAAEGVTAGLEFAKEQTDLQTDIDLDSSALKVSNQEDCKSVLALLREEAPLRMEIYTQKEIVQQTGGRYLAALASGQRLLDERVAFRKKTAGQATKLRYQDMTFRIFRNDAIQKYRAQFDLAARYTYMAATAYDYEVNLLGQDGKAGRRFFNDIIRQRSLGQMKDGNPAAGRFGLADPLARMSQNFKVLKTQMGFNNPQTEENSFSLRSEWFRVRPHDEAQPDEAAETLWRNGLKKCRVADLWQLPEFRRYCRPMAPEIAGPQPAIVIRFPTTVTFGLNFFGWPLGGRDSAYDPSQYSTRVRSAGVWFSGYNGNGLSYTPRVYLIPIGADVLRSPNSDNFETRLWRVVDQKIPTPFPIGSSEMQNASYIPAMDNLGGELAAIRKSASFRAYHDAGFTPDQMTRDSRLIGRSVWNTEWMLVIPGGTLLNDSNAGLDLLIDSITDIRFSFQTYAYSGN